MSFVTLNFLVPGLLIVISYSKILQVRVLPDRSWPSLSWSLSISGLEVTLGLTPAQFWLTAEIDASCKKKLHLYDCYLSLITKYKFITKN